MKNPHSHPIRWLLIIVVLLLGTGVVVWWQWNRKLWLAFNALDHADQYELLSLNPERSDVGFYNHAILGRITIVDSDVRRRLKLSLRKGIRDGKDPAACFQPRHGIRVVHAGVATDFLICFECGQIYAWKNGEPLGPFVASGSPGEGFNDVLRKATVSLTP